MKRHVIPVVAAGLAATSLSFTPAPADADPTGAYSGYSSSAVATPIKVEVFEPTIPIPTVPQAEFDMGYVKVKADSASTRGRASFLWPGDGVGEGLKTFVEQLGLPTELVANGYPAQVNSQYPSDTPKAKNTPFPGTSMSTASEDGTTRATVGFSNDCNAGDGAGDDSGDPTDDGGAVVPGLPGLPLLENLDDILAVVGLGRGSAPPPSSSASGTSSRSSAKAEDGSANDGSGAGDSDTCQLPAALSALVDVNGYVADTQSVAGPDAVTTTSRSALGDVRLLGGIVTLSGLSTTLISTSDGTTGVAKGRADYGTMTIAGQTFGIGPEGFVAADQSGPIPGLPDDPTAALAALGITIELPQPTYKAVGDKASGVVEGLIVTLDLKTLAPVLSQLQLGPILDQAPFPPEAAPLTSALSSIGNLSPRVVLHLGYTTAAVDTVQPLDLPDAVPDNDPTGDEGEDAGGAASGGAIGGGGAAGLGGSALPGGDASSTSPTATTAPPLTDAALTAGLPKLFSIPGLLLFAGLGGALLAGSYVRRIGALVLGGAGACSHGLESGLPDLRQVR